MLTDSFYAITYLHKAPITVSFRFPIYRLYAKKIIIFSNKTYSVLIFALLNLIWVNIWNHEKNHCKDLGLVKHFAIYHDFNGLNHDIFYFISKVFI